MGCLLLLLVVAGGLHSDGGVTAEDWHAQQAAMGDSEVQVERPAPPPPPPPAPTHPPPPPRH